MKYHFYWTLFFILLNYFGEAQTFKKIGVEEGLPSSSVYDLKVDEYNRMWIATFGGGITCYDGLKFKVINQDNGLNNDLIRSISLDKITGNIYVGSQGAFEVITKDSIINLNNAINDTTGSNVLLTSIVGNTVYASTQDGFITLVNHKKVNIVKRVTAVNYLMDDENNLWLPTRSNLYIKLKNGELLDFKKMFNITIEGISDIVKYQNKIILATKTGLYIFDKLKLINIINKQSGLPNEYTRCLLVDKSKLWIGTKNGLISTTDLKKFEFFGSKNGIDECEIKCLALDKNGLLWAGSNTCGIFKMINSDIVKYDFNAQPISFSTDSKKNVYALVKNSIKIFNTDSNNFINYIKLEGFENLKQFCFDKDNSIYLTLGDIGVLKVVPPSTKTIIKYNLRKIDYPVLSLLVDNNKLWIGYKRRIIKYDFITNTSDSTDFKNIHARYFQKFLRNGSDIWIATEKGISKYNAGSYFEISNNTVKNFPEGIVNCLAADKYNHLWIAADRGLFCLEDKKVYSNYRKDNFPTNEISDITVLDTFLFAATNKGLIQVAIKPNRNKNCTYQIINKRNGLNDFDLTNKAIYSDSNYIWIAHEKGAYRYKPSALAKIELPIYISNISGELGSLVFKNSKNFTNQIVNLNTPLYLNYLDNDFTIEFNSINYNLVGSVYYSYRLKGLNSNWSLPSSETKAVYTNLGPGDYVFEVSASNGKTNFGKIILYKIYISPPFYQTLWYKVMAVVLGIIIIYFLVRLRLRGIIRKNLILENKVNNRTKELKFKSLELEHTNSELLKKGKLINESLEYAKKIQESILPSQGYLNTQFNNIVQTASIYLPKDIVSGDFYYTYRKGHINYFALVDCTGHGVPGALLSFSINSILHGIIDNLDEFKEPAYILKKLREGFSEIYIKDQDVKESFAISLAIYNDQTKKIYFSGISQSVLILAKNELMELKSQNSFLELNTKDFNTQELSVEKGNRIYLYSDGFYDQKGEKTKRRLYKIGLSNLITETKELTLEKQIEALQSHFMAFKGHNEQIDDVTLFAIEIQ